MPRNTPGCIQDTQPYKETGNIKVLACPLELMPVDFTGLVQGLPAVHYMCRRSVALCVSRTPGRGWPRYRVITSALLAVVYSLWLNMRLGGSEECRSYGTLCLPPPFPSPTARQDSVQNVICSREMSFYQIVGRSVMCADAFPRLAIDSRYPSQFTHVASCSRVHPPPVNKHPPARHPSKTLRLTWTFVLSST